MTFCPTFHIPIPIWLKYGVKYLPLNSVDFSRVSRKSVRRKPYFIYRCKCNFSLFSVVFFRFYYNSVHKVTTHVLIQCLVVSWKSAQWKLCFTRPVNDFPNFPRLLLDLGEIRYKIYEDMAAEYLWVFVKPAKECHAVIIIINEITFTRVLWKRMLFEVKNTVVNSVCYVTSAPFTAFLWLAERNVTLRNTDFVDFRITHFAYAGNIIYLSKKHQLLQACRDVSKRSFLAEVLSCISSIFPYLLR